MSPKTVTGIHCTLALLFFLLIRALISYTALSSFAAIVIDAKFDNSSTVEIFYSTGKEFRKDKSFHSQPFPQGKRTVQKIYLKNNVVRSLRIDTGNGEGISRIYKLRLGSFFGDNITFDPKDIYEKFSPNSSIDSYELKDDHLLISASTSDPYLVSTETIQVNNFFLLHIFPLLLTFLFWIFISSFKIRSFPPIDDLYRKKSSMGVNIDSLDGIRGIAALMVLTEHTGILKGIGALGVWLFFTLSGFLLVTPFIHTPAKAYSFSYMQSFLLRRLKRIVPMYYTFLLITMLFKVRNPEIFRHFLFLQGDGHLWTIPQEMFFYLLLPFVMLLCCIPIPRQKLFSSAILLVMIWAANTYLTSDVVSLYGYGDFMRPLAGIFLSGVLFSYVYYWLRSSSLFNRLNQQGPKHFFSTLGILLLIALVSIIPQAVKEITHFDTQIHFGITGFLCAIFIFLTVMSEGTFLGKLTSFLPLRAVGLVGFSFYLLHPTLIWFCREVMQYYFDSQLSKIELIFVAGGLTYLLSMMTYTYIERPFLVSKK